MRIKWLEGIAILLIFQLIGEVVAIILDIPVPGPVIGMLLLLVTLLLRGVVSKSLDSTASSIISHLSLLFIPAGVGVMTHFDRIEAEWLPITLALVFSTILTLALTAVSMKLVQTVIVRRRESNVR